MLLGILLAGSLAAPIEAASLSPYLAYDGVFYTNSYHQNNTLTHASQLPNQLVVPKKFNLAKMYQLLNQSQLSKAEFKQLYQTKYAAPYFFYRQSAADKTAKVAVNHLTSAQIDELSAYSLQLINGVRKKLHLRQLVMNKTTQAALASYVKYRTNHRINVHPQNITVWYDLLCQYYNISKTKATKANFVQGNYFVGENVAFDYAAYRTNQAKNPPTMLALKISIYNGISAMVFADNIDGEAWGHFQTIFAPNAKSLAMGVQTNTKWQPNDARSQTEFVWLISSQTAKPSKKSLPAKKRSAKKVKKTPKQKRKVKKQTKVKAKMSKRR